MICAAPIGKTQKASPPLRKASKWKGHRECHVAPDWLLVYKKTSDAGLFLFLIRVASHNEMMAATTIEHRRRALSASLVSVFLMAIRDSEFRVKCLSRPTLIFCTFLYQNFDKTQLSRYNLLAVENYTHSQISLLGAWGLTKNHVNGCGGKNPS